MWKEGCPLGKWWTDFTCLDGYPTCHGQQGMHYCHTLSLSGIWGYHSITAHAFCPGWSPHKYKWYCTTLGVQACVGKHFCINMYSSTWFMYITSLSWLMIIRSSLSVIDSCVKIYQNDMEENLHYGSTCVSLTAFMDACDVNGWELHWKKHFSCKRWPQDCGPLF